MIQCNVHFMCMCVYVENTAMASWIKNDLFTRMWVCTCWESLLNQCIMKEKCPQGVCSRRENISPIILAQTVMIWICTRLQCVIAAENSIAFEGHKSTRHTGANNVILLPENVNRMMGLWIRITPHSIHEPIAERQHSRDIPSKPRI